MHPVEAYLSHLHASLGAGTPETSGYPALYNLLNAVGDSLKPKITAIIHPQKKDAGIPDGALYSTKDLKKHGHEPNTLFGKLKPERGVIEVKPLDMDLSAFESGTQVRNYLDSYRQILLTNYRSFAIWSMENGKPVRGEHYHFAANETDFWSKVASCRGNPKHPEYERLWQYLRRALLATARIATPQDLAAFLASYAREARARIEIAPMGTLEPVKKALSEALGIHFEGEKGIHFFQSTLIQTLFYGIFSAWVLWHEEHPKSGDRFQWRLASQHLGLPILRTLFNNVADSRKIRALDLEEVLDWSEECLTRVDRASFFTHYNMGDAVQYFYEPFLAEFDPELRKAFGVWYTPPEIVRYMVSSVDAALRENFNLPDGLADPSVVVLDPCCGTGAYLVETLRLIHTRLVEGYGPAQAALKIREVAKHQLYGFELLPAPYVVSHLQIDLMLTRWGAKLDHEQDERAGVFLTNALTGWVPIKTPKDLPFSEFTEERDAADQVKQKEQILVIIGNPPYDGHPGMAIGEERGLTQAYRSTKHAPKPEGRGLNELYVRFFRMAERRISEGVPQHDDLKPGPPRHDAKGIVCFISNYSWLEGHSHTGLRERFMEVFDNIRVDCLNGDSRESGKKTPDGRPDPSVFSTAKNREGIKVGTAIAMLERRPFDGGLRLSQPYSEIAYTPIANIQFRHWWGKDKVRELANVSATKRPWMSLSPGQHARLEFFPQASCPTYSEWPSLPMLLPKKFAGVQTSRDVGLVEFDIEPLRERMKAYYDPAVSMQMIRKRFPDLAREAFDYDPVKVRTDVAKIGFDEASFKRFAYRPFDVRWLFWEGRTKLLHRPSPDLYRQFVPNSLFLVCQPKTRGLWFPPQVITTLGCLDLMDRGASFLPLIVQTPNEEDQQTDSSHPDLFASNKPVGPQPNLTDFAHKYLASLKCDPEHLFFHIVAALHSPLYRQENSGALRQDWPRVPLPKDATTLRAGAALGRQLAALLDPETPVPGVTDLKVREDLKGLGELTVSEGKSPDLAIAATWGSLQKAKNGDIIMPGPGKTTSGTRGEGYLDIHLNATTRWKDVPEPVWTYTLGGYQVLKKWLSYRESALLGRPLTSDEAQQFTHHVRRIASILALQGKLDEHYRSATESSL
jgi:hypothetical protein